MSRTDEDLDRLNDLLNGIPSEWEGMTIEDLDGCVTVLVVSLNGILLSEWLPGGKGGESEFSDLVEADVKDVPAFAFLHFLDAQTGRQINRRSPSRPSG